jgi:hypothetical protein
MALHHDRFSISSVLTLRSFIAAESLVERHRPRLERSLLFLVGIALLVGGIASHGDAQGLTTHYNDERFSNAANAIMTYLEGSFGALIMACAGVGAIVSAAFGQYRAALSLLVVAVGAFIVRSVMSTFLNDSKIQP